MSEQFDISTNRVPHGLLTPEERKQLEAAAKVPGARVEYCEDFYPPIRWGEVPRPAWLTDVAYRVHLPAAEYAEAKARASGKHPRQLPCGCVPCICEDPVRCRGCGAVCCEEHKGGKPADAAPDAAPVETWEYEGKRYKLVPDSGLRCGGCVFWDKPRLCSLSPNCGDGMRPDGKNMIFVEDAPAPVPPAVPNPTRIEPLCILSAPYRPYSDYTQSDIVAAINNNIAKINELVDALNELRGAK